MHIFNGDWKSLLIRRTFYEYSTHVNINYLIKLYCIIFYAINIFYIVSSVEKYNIKYITYVYIHWLKIVWLSSRKKHTIIFISSNYLNCLKTPLISKRLIVKILPLEVIDRNFNYYLINTFTNIIKCFKEPTYI